MRIVLVGGTGPVGQATTPHLLAAGHELAVAHSGAHEPPGVADVEHLHASRDALLARDGPVERWHPEVLVDTFAGGATAAKARQLGDLAESCGAGRIVAVSSEMCTAIAPRPVSTTSRPSSFRSIPCHSPRMHLAGHRRALREELATTTWRWRTLSTAHPRSACSGRARSTAPTS